VKIGYRGFDRTGKSARGIVDAPDARTATENLRRQGIFVLELSSADGGGGAEPAAARTSKFSLGASSRSERVCLFFRQLSMLVRTGTPVAEALASLQRQATNEEWSKVLTQVRMSVEEGKSLADAMGPHPAYFDAVARSLVAAGEGGGRLDEMLDRLCALTRQQVKLRKTVTHAMIYPSLLLCVSLVVLCAMVGFVLPRFEGLFQSLGSGLPPMTKVLMMVSHFLRNNWMFIAPSVLCALGGVVWWVRTPRGQRAIDVTLVRAPKLGLLTKSYAAARIARVLGTLLDGKVPLLEALVLAKHSVGNSLYVELMNKAEDAVIRGDTLSSALCDPNLVSPSVIEAVRSGERAGQLAPVLISVADFMEEDTESAVKTVTGLLEPAILLLLGVVVGTMAISMLLPLFDLTASGPNGAGGGA